MMKIVIIGGVAGGASTAARLRRLDEMASIIVFERGDYVSFANCGLPYHISEVIPERDDLILKTPRDFLMNFAIDVRIRNEVLSIDRAHKTVDVIDHSTGRRYSESYDKLVLSPGAAPFIPPMKGYTPERVLTLRTIPDMDRIKAHIQTHSVKRALVIGGGFIGIEVAENLAHITIQTHLVELGPQVMMPFDADMASHIHRELELNGIQLHLNESIDELTPIPNGTRVTLKSKKTLEVDLIVSAVGVRPESDLAEKAKLDISGRKAILVNETMQTSDPDIYALGDAIEVRHLNDDTPTLLPLAGVASKQARIVANHIAGLPTRIHRVQGTAIVKVFQLAAAVTGLNVREAKKRGLDIDVLQLHPFQHVGYYPGARQMALKVIVDRSNDHIIGAQCIGPDGVDKRIDILALAIRNQMKASELQDVELCYAPPFGVSKDPIHMVGQMVENIRSKLVTMASVEDLQQNPDVTIIDVRTPDEFRCGQIPNAINIPLYEVRQRLSEIPRHRPIIVHCAVGIRAYNAARILMQHGFNDVRNLSGGYKSYCAQTQDCHDRCGLNHLPSPSDVLAQKPQTNGSPMHRLKLEGLQCPGPILAIKKKLDDMGPGDTIEATVSDVGFMKDIPAFCESTGHTLLDLRHEKGIIRALIQKGTLTGTTNKKTLVVFSGDLDKALATFIIANGARAMGSDVTLFFTFWGLNILRDSKKTASGKSLIESMFGWMMPKGASKLALSKMNMLGMGTWMMKWVMNQKRVDTLEALIREAQQSGIHLIACSMSMDVMGIKKEELIDGVEIGGVAHFLHNAEQSNMNLFI